MPGRQRVIQGFILGAIGLLGAIWAGELPNDIRWVRNSTEYQALCTQVYSTAWTQVREMAREQDQPWAIIMDLDETVLDNSLYQVEITERQETFTMTSWAEFVNRAESGLVPGAKAFLDSVHTLPGGRIIYISNRMAEREAATRTNLESLGILDMDDVFLLRLEKADTKDIRRQESILGTGRMQEIGPQLILAYFGDAMGDFPQDSAYSWGVSKFILPNPMYGKW